MKVSALLLLVIASAAGYAASEEQQDGHPPDEQVQRAASMLARRGDPDSLAAAAALTFMKDRAGAEQLAARASAAGPNRPDLLWLHATLCGETPNCDRKALDAKLRALDPENGITLVSALVEASDTVPRRPPTGVRRRPAQARPGPLHHERRGRSRRTHASTARACMIPCRAPCAARFAQAIPLIRELL
jgi:hypothetical protein